MTKHEPVLIEEVVDAVAHLKSQSTARKTIIDATVGFGGHSSEFVRRGFYVIGLDADGSAIDIAQTKLARVLRRQDCGGQACPASKHASECFKLVNANYRDIDKVTEELGVESVDAILFDLGVNTFQLTSRERGFSYKKMSSDLDMRLSPEKQSVCAKDLLNSLRDDQLTNLFIDYLPTNQSKRLAKNIVEKRARKKFQTVSDFVDVIKKSGAKGRASSIDDETLAFMALRIAVNSELDTLSNTLPKALALIRSGGRLVVISFHSGEDKIVKIFGREMEVKEKVRVITKRPIVSTKEEKARNKRSRSAKMRIFEKI